MRQQGQVPRVRGADGASKARARHARPPGEPSEDNSRKPVGARGTISRACFSLACTASSPAPQLWGLLLGTLDARAGAPVEARRPADEAEGGGDPAHGEHRPKQARRTTVTENEVNSYLAYEAADQLPAGVVSRRSPPSATGRISGRAVVDLDAVRKAGNSTSLFDPRSYLTGQLPVTATGVLHASNGVGRFELESASVGGVPIPKMLLQEIVGLLLEEPRESGRYQPRRSVCSCRRAFARFRSSEVKPSSCNEITITAEIAEHAEQTRLWRAPRVLRLTL